jgi:hypothetical protein
MILFTRVSNSSQRVSVAILSSETSVLAKATVYHIPEDGILHESPCSGTHFKQELSPNLSNRSLSIINELLRFYFTLIKACHESLHLVLPAVRKIGPLPYTFAVGGDVATARTTQGLSSSTGEVKNFLYFTASSLTLGRTRPTANRYWCCSASVKRRTNGANNSTANITQIKKTQIYNQVSS